MSYHLDDTIAAIASPPGGGARGIVRVSGPGTLACVEALFEPDEPVRLAALERPSVLGGAFRLPQPAPTLPGELYFWPGPGSYTGETVAEIHTLGSQPLLEALVEMLCQAGARPAEPGEFTLRAFLAGRIDLTRAEAVLGVIDAADPRELHVALTQLAGGLAGPLSELRDRLIELLAHLEAGFDFPDEDIDFIAPDELARQLEQAARSVEDVAQKMASRGEVADTARVVLVGWPNCGKSSLFNRLLGEAGALVSSRPGATRDYLSADLDLQGVRCRLIDTAGVEPDEAEPDDVRAMAQTATGRQRRHARVQVLCLDLGRPINAWEQAELDSTPPGQRIVVLTKADLPRHAGCTHRALETSSLTGLGIERLRQRIRDAVLAAGESHCGAVAGTAVRCRESLRLAARCLERAVGLLESQGGEELVAAEVRSALNELGKTVGAVYTDDILDRVFSRFCVGK